MSNAYLFIPDDETLDYMLNNLSILVPKRRGNSSKNKRIKKKILVQNLNSVINSVIKSYMSTVIDHAIESRYEEG